MASLNGDRARPTIEVQVEVKESTFSPERVWFGARLFVDGRRFAGSFEFDSSDILNVSEFFASLREPGRFALFTCTCGCFGCGGCWTDVDHTANAWIARNNYDATQDDPTLADLQEESQLTASWADIRSVAASIDRELGNARRAYPGWSLRNGTAGAVLDDVHWPR